MLLRSLSDVTSSLSSLVSGSVFNPEKTRYHEVVLVPNFAHDEERVLYWNGPCGADVLARCDAGVSFIDLDEVSYGTFTKRFTGKATRVILYYQPSILDPYFATADTTKSNSTGWRRDNDESATEIIVGRVNCYQNPIGECRHVDGRLPFMDVIVPSAPQNFTYAHKLLAKFDTDASNCLWRQYGAGILKPRCHSGVTSLKRIQQSDEGDERTHSFIREGERIAFAWNALIVLASLTLLGALCLAVWRYFLKKCLADCRGPFRPTFVARNSASLSKDERKVQLQQQVKCFQFAAVIFGLTNMFLPAVALFVALPVAIAALAWLWFVEFKCATPASCHRGRRQVGENQIPLLSSEQT